MDFISNHCNLLIEHIKNNYSKNDKIKFYFQSSIDHDLNTLKDYSILYLGLSLNSKKTPKDKIYLSKSKTEYKKNNNIFNIYFGILIKNLNDYLHVYRILVDFPFNKDKILFKVMNINENILFDSNNLIKTFLNKINQYNKIYLSNFLFIESELIVETLQDTPIVRQVKRVELNLKRK